MKFTSELRDSWCLCSNSICIMDLPALRASLRMNSLVRTSHGHGQRVNITSQKMFARDGRRGGQGVDIMFPLQACMDGAVLRPEHGIRQKIKRQKVKRQNSKGRQSNGRKIKRQKKQQAENSVGRKSKCRNYYCDYFILRKHLKHAENGQMLKASQPR